MRTSVSHDSWSPRRPFGRVAALALPAILAMACWATGARADRPGDEAEWGAVAQPSSGPTHVIGTYSNGCIDGAVSLPLDGVGYSVIRPQRNRYWGHPSMIAFIQNLGFAMVGNGLGVLMVADIGQPRGGPITGHASHELGLDADIWLQLLPANLLAMDVSLRTDPVSRSAVLPGTTQIDRSFWSPAHVEMYRLAATNPYVDRIFANAVIKRELCETVTGDRSWLAKIRPWYGHDEHMHVRLVCPPDSPECRPQAPLPAGDGCGDDLAWWFTDGPNQPSTEPAPPPPPLPASCMQVLAR
ncbi:MAG: penicillin-insensitive murein endopeptidase [Alphaproteobacteria bacterium]